MTGESADTPLFLREFPDYDDPDIVLPEGFEDGSWGNEQCPLFFDDEAGLMFAVDYADPSRREFPEGPRFALHEYARSGSRGEPTLVACSDVRGDIDALIGHVRDVAAAVSSEAVERLREGGAGELGDLPEYVEGAAAMKERFLFDTTLVDSLRRQGVIEAVNGDGAEALDGIAAACWRAAKSRTEERLETSATPGM